MYSTRSAGQKVEGTRASIIINSSISYCLYFIFIRLICQMYLLFNT
jgi:hypothetical protein